MSDWIGLGIFVVVGVLALVAMSRLGRPPKQISVEEFEKRARSGGHTRAGMFGLQQLLHPKAVKAIEVQQDLRHGYYNKKRVPGEGDDEEATGDATDANAGEDSNSNAGAGSDNSDLD